ncbi:hypothetical protein OQJ18_09820 [Fluoribacter dumoffii]|uniref:hypothetical protein n=1 Tax=Fluoribacter dumoffii TaxID=463 RepID=UPI0022434578|nr:hypothetical protein [Fluoribacter dumoffii]MCW8417606.1 hypothetical protein [Fluoribacter dumoffii]MCW8454552.1 hypothetical protein [Fluoribacter dumoffii]MCW8461372.1 hypothetical protein [Fluoribacter dumoffii]MCW8484813.1 hypothetical protein [Fluoribacter dumoffii]
MVLRPKRTFKEAATKFLMENQHKRSISDDAGRLRELVKYIGDMSIEAIHIGSLQSFIEGRKKDGVSMRTINHGLKIVRRILNLAASEWMDEFGLTWLSSAPKIKLLPEPDLRKPYPLSWDEQHKQFQLLPEHLKNMALFAVNTGCRDREICELRWDWEIQIPELPHIIVFIVGEERLIVCNETVREVIEGERGKHPTHVFSFKGRPLSRMLSTG